MGMMIILVLAVALGAAWYFVKCPFCRQKSGPTPKTSPSVKCPATSKCCTKCAQDAPPGSACTFTDSKLTCKKSVLCESPTPNLVCTTTKAKGKVAPTVTGCACKA